MYPFLSHDPNGIVTHRIVYKSCILHVGSLCLYFVLQSCIITHEERLRRFIVFQHEILLARCQYECDAINNIVLSVSYEQSSPLRSYQGHTQLKPAERVHLGRDVRIIVGSNVAAPNLNYQLVFENFLGVSQPTFHDSLALLQLVVEGGVVGYWIVGDGVGGDGRERLLLATNVEYALTVFFLADSDGEFLVS